MFLVRLFSKLIKQFKCNYCHPTDITCPAGWWHFGRRCYRLSSLNDWPRAFTSCFSLDAHLAILEGKPEFDFVVNLVLATRKSLWVSLKSNGSGLEWIGEDQLKYHQPILPKDLCMVARFIGGTVQWQLQKCVGGLIFYPLCVLGNFYD